MTMSMPTEVLPSPDCLFFFRTGIHSLSQCQQTWWEVSSKAKFGFLFSWFIGQRGPKYSAVQKPKHCLTWDFLSPLSAAPSMPGRGSSQIPSRSLLFSLSGRDYITGFPIMSRRRRRRRRRGKLGRERRRPPDSTLSLPGRRIHTCYFSEIWWKLVDLHYWASRLELL